METPTPFDLNGAIQRWRAEFGSPSSLSAVEVEELEAHLRDHVAVLQTEGMAPEDAFLAAVKQMGDRQRVAAEFAKIDPQRIWLEGAIGMVVGVFLFSVVHRLTLEPARSLFNHGWNLGWDPVLCVVLSRLGSLGGMILVGVLLWWIVARRPRWGRALVNSCEGSPLATGVAMLLILWATGQMGLLWNDVLFERLPRLHTWLFPALQAPYPDATLMNRIGAWVEVGGKGLWEVALCVLAALVARTRVRCVLPSTAGTPQTSAKEHRLERLLWMTAGYVLVAFAIQDLHGSFLAAAVWAQPLLGHSAVPQHVLGFGLAVLYLTLWAMPFWGCWYVASRGLRLGAWAIGAFRHHPIAASVGVLMLLNAGYLLGLVLLCIGIHLQPVELRIPDVVWQWVGTSMRLAWWVAPAVLLVALLRGRTKLRAARATLSTSPTPSL